MSEPVLTDIGLESCGRFVLLFCDEAKRPVAPLLTLEGLRVSLEDLKALGEKSRSEVLAVLFDAPQADNFQPFKQLPATRGI